MLALISVADVVCVTHESALDGTYRVFKLVISSQLLVFGKRGVHAAFSRLRPYCCSRVIQSSNYRTWLYSSVKLHCFIVTYRRLDSVLQLVCTSLQGMCVIIAKDATPRARVRSSGSLRSVLALKRELQ